jgi:uncharacterized protein
VVKLYADEPEAAVMRGLGALVVSGLARVEVPAALWRKHRLGDLSVPQTSELVAQFEEDWFEARRFGIVSVTERLLESAAAALARYPLRAYDAVQLASALVARGAYPTLERFACFDRTLAAAAAAEGFEIIGSD